MPRYVVERTLPKLSSEELQAIGKQVVEVAEQMPGVTWIKSSISESEGKSYCEFEAPNPEVLLEHSKKVGLPVDKISAVEIQVDPSMFR
ncbi:MAG: DUF4242 domain-containing protein [Pseudomonadota bacterium]